MRGRGWTRYLLLTSGRCERLLGGFVVARVVSVVELVWSLLLLLLLDSVLAARNNVGISGDVVDAVGLVLGGPMLDKE